MELGILAIFVVGAVIFVVMIGGMYAAIRRMQGHPTRFDRFYESVAQLTGAQRAGIYPPSLRGDPTPQIQEDVEVSRGDRSVRGTPGNRPSDEHDA